ncbi:MAG: ribulose-phosphate 3-epimerase [Dehalococcoidia bacterium]
MRAIKIAPSIVSADLAHLADQVRECEAAGAAYIHIDVMDGQFVPAITIGAPIVEAIRRTTALVLDVHLMVIEPEKQVERFIEAGGDIINVHWESATHLHRIIHDVQERGRRAGVCLNPGTSEGVLDAVLPELDQVMVMSVNPGASGQPFIETVLPKVERLRRTIDENGYRAEIEIDGGVNTSVVPRCAAAGADALVAASAIFNERGSIGENIRGLRESIASMRA